MTTDNSVLVTKVKEKNKSLARIAKPNRIRAGAKIGFNGSLHQKLVYQAQLHAKPGSAGKNQQSFRDFSFRASLRQRRVLFRHGRKQSVYR